MKCLNIELKYYILHVDNTYIFKNFFGIQKKIFYHLIFINELKKKKNNNVHI